MFLLVSKTLKTTVLLFLLGECNISATEICFGPRLFMCGFSFEFDPPVGNAWGDCSLGLLSMHSLLWVSFWFACLNGGAMDSVDFFLQKKAFRRFIFLGNQNLTSAVTLKILVFFSGKKVLFRWVLNCNIFRLVRKKGKVDCSS